MQTVEEAVEPGEGPSYIPDTDIDLAGNDALGTYPYVLALKEMVLECPTPFTIGLFGGWGSGKSSVAGTLCREVRDDESAYAFIYDAWKYSRDSMYRTFLMEFADHFGLKKTELLKRFYGSKSQEIDHEIVPSHNAYFTLIAVSILATALIWVFHSAKLVSTDLSIAVSVMSAAIALFTFAIKNVFVIYKTSLNLERAFAPEQFEEAFGEAVLLVLGKASKHPKWFQSDRDPAKVPPYESDRLLVVIDNVDRCRDEAAVQLLETVKNFLEVPGVMYLVPIDPSAVKSHLGLADPQASEYLRKILNTSLSIRRFTSADLFGFTTALVKKHRLALSAETAAIVAQEFATNPRRIIEFLNSFLNELALAKHQERNAFVAPGAITGHEDVLAKVLILKSEWPTLYSFIAADPLRLEALHKAIESGRYEFHLGDELYHFASSGVPDFLPDLTPNQFRFLMRCSAIGRQLDLDPFFVNKDQAPGIPDQVGDAVLSQDWETISDVLSSGKLDESALIDFVLGIGDRDLIQRGLLRTSGYNVLGLLAKMFSDEQWGPRFVAVLDANRVNRLAALVQAPGLGQVLPSLPPLGLAKLAKVLSEREQDYFLTLLLNMAATLDGLQAVDSDEEEAA